MTKVVRFFTVSLALAFCSCSARQAEQKPSTLVAELPFFGRPGQVHRIESGPYTCFVVYGRSGKPVSISCAK